MTTGSKRGLAGSDRRTFTIRPAIGHKCSFVFTASCSPGRYPPALSPAEERALPPGRSPAHAATARTIDAHDSVARKMSTGFDLRPSVCRFSIRSLRAGHEYQTCTLRRHVCQPTFLYPKFTFTALGSDDGLPVGRLAARARCREPCIATTRIGGKNDIKESRLRLAVRSRPTRAG